MIVHEWEHWKNNSNTKAEQLLSPKQSLETAKRLDIRREIEIIVDGISNTKGGINIIAKSIGTKVAMSLAPIIKEQLRKVILCGIPIDPLGYRRGLKIIGSNNLLVIQNSKDPFMPFSAIKIYMKLMDNNIKVIQKLSSTHDYRYYKEFGNFLRSAK